MNRPSLTRLSSGIGDTCQGNQAREPFRESGLPLTDISELARASHPKIATGASRQRIPALDFTKGALVLIMVLYHWMNYFLGSYASLYKYLRFLTPSFIFITGFLISHVYLSRYDVRYPRLPNRLLRRGFKLFGLLVLLNVTASLLFPGSPHTLFHNLSARNVLSAYVTGNAGKAVAFSVLAPISYLLLLSAALVAVSRVYRNIFRVTCWFFLFGILMLHIHGIQSGNLELLGIGLLGVLCGYTPIDRINNIVKHPYALVLAYLGYLCAITVWHEVYPLQIVGVCLSLSLLYWLGARSDKPGRIRRTVMLLGNYSLFGYIAQIAILQLLHRSLPRIGLGTGTLSISFFAAVALTVVSVEAIDRVRIQAKVVDRLYAAVFA